MLAFAAFVVLWRERAGPPRLLLVAAAGALAGFAIATEYPLGLAAVILGLYAMRRSLKRGAAYAAGVAAGIAPLVIYNVWAFGTPTHSSYKGAVAIQGDTGHDVVGLNDGGFFGIELPDFQIALDLLFANKGLITLAPILALALVGLVLLHRRGLRAEAYVIGGMFLAYLTYNSGYWLPFGGGSPGPRFLIPVIPFLAVPLALAWRRWPATALALAAVSAVLMATATVTLPLIGNDDIGYWWHIVEIETFEHTIASVAGLDNGWLALAPFLAALLGVGGARRARDRPRRVAQPRAARRGRHRPRLGRARRGAARVPRPRPRPGQPFRRAAHRRCGRGRARGARGFDAAQAARTSVSRSIASTEPHPASPIVRSKSAMKLRMTSSTPARPATASP